jgi:two-component system chemotaxis sensor kinase CheA
VSGNAEYLELFVAEAQENLQALSDGALRLEKGGSDLVAVRDLFRAAHTLKGMAATMGYEGLTQVCHALEDALDAVRSGAQGLTPGLADALLAAVDGMGAMLGAIAGGGDGGPADAALVARFRSLAAGEIPPASFGAPGPAEAPAAAAPAGVSQAADPQLPSGEEGRQAVARALNDGGVVARVSVGLEATCAFKGVRALLVRKALERLGKVACTWPAGKALEEGAFDQGFDVWVASSAPLEELEQAALRVLEVARASAVAVPGNAFAVDAPQAAQPLAAPSLAFEPEGALSPAPLSPEAVSELLAVPLAMAGEMTLAPEAPSPMAAIAAGARDAAEPLAPTRQTLRVSVERLDKVLNLVGELVTAKIRLGQIGRVHHLKDLGEALIQVDHIVNELQEEVTAARMVPMEQIFSRFPRLIRDLSHELNKPMELVMEGREIELDRSILDEIAEALVHLLRNSADHGIEPPEERRRRGKAATGTIRLEARRDKNHVVISVEDDGAGIDTAKVRDAAVRKGLLTAEAAQNLSEEEAVSLIFAAGFSTVSQVTKISGRGVGVDAVRARAESLGGNLRVENYPGHGTRFRIRLPLTLAIVQALRVRVGREEYMAPVVNVIEAVEYQRSELKRTHGIDTVMLRDEVLPVSRLSRLLDVPGGDEAELFTVLVIETAERRAGLIVDEVLGQQEIAIKNLGRSLKAVRGFGGVTILGDGSVCLILELASLLEN